jgi:hypothetical protein
MHVSTHLSLLATLQRLEVVSEVSKMLNPFFERLDQLLLLGYVLFDASISNIYRERCALSSNSRGKSRDDTGGRGIKSGINDGGKE